MSNPKPGNKKVEKPSNLARNARNIIPPARRTSIPPTTTNPPKNRNIPPASKAVVPKKPSNSKNVQTGNRTDNSSLTRVDVSPTDKNSFIKLFSAKPSDGGFRVDGGKFNFNFTTRSQISCEQIAFHSCTLIFNNLNLCGSFRFINCTVTISNSKFIRYKSEYFAVLSTDKASFLKAYNVSINGKEFIGSANFNDSTAHFINCTFLHCKTCVFMENYSICISIQTDFGDSKEIPNNQHCIVNESSSFIAFDCKFSQSNSVSISSSNSSHFLLYGCIFSECHDSLIQALYSTECVIEQCNLSTLNTEHPAICLNQSEVKISSCLFDKINTLSIEALVFSKVAIDNCIFQNGKSSALNFQLCDSVFIQNSIIQNFAKNGITIISTSICQILSTNLENCNYGVTVKYDCLIGIENCVFHHMGKNSLRSLGNSSIIATKSIFSSSLLSHFISYLGGTIEVDDSKIVHSSTTSPVFILTMNGNGILRDLDVTSVHNSMCEYKGAPKFQQSFVKLNGKILNKLDIKNPNGKPLSNLKCFLCGCDANGNYLLPCLHKVYCSDCFKKVTLPTECPACDEIVSKTMEPGPLETDEQCPVCMTEMATMMIVPCGHRFCPGCLNDWKKNGGGEKQCMTCYADVSLNIAIPKYN